MADQKITALTALTGANSAPGDLLTLVDVSDTTMDAAGTNKSITRQELQTYNAGTLTTDVKVLDLSATWNAAGVTFAGLKFNVTDTASNAASLLLDLQVGGVSQISLQKNGKIKGRSGGNQSLTMNASDGVLITVNDTSANSISVSLLNSAGYLVDTGGSRVGWSSTGLTVSRDQLLGFNSAAVGNSSADLSLYRDAADTLAQRRTTNAQIFRLYNTFTDASNYERLGINWGSNIVSIAPEAAGTGTVRVLHISGLPTSNPGPGILWNDSNTVKVGT